MFVLCSACALPCLNTLTHSMCCLWAVHGSNTSLGPQILVIWALPSLFPKWFPIQLAIWTWGELEVSGFWQSSNLQHLKVIVCYSMLGHALSVLNSVLWSYYIMLTLTQWLALIVLVCFELLQQHQRRSYGRQSLRNLLTKNLNIRTALLNTIQMLCVFVVCLDCS